MPEDACMQHGAGSCPHFENPNWRKTAAAARSMLASRVRGRVPTSMFVDYVSSRVIAAGVVAWPLSSAAPGSGGRTTLIAKLELARSASGEYRLVDTPERTITLDQVDAAGELLFPTDFAPYKPQCDVIVIGAAVAHRGPGRLAIGPSARAVEPGEGLGPRQSFCPEGDPLDSTVAELWSTGGIDFVRFQAAPPDRRIAWPGPFELEYARGSLRVTGRVVGPFPRAFVLSADGMRVLGRVPMLLDTIALEPDRDRVILVFRAIYDRTYPANVPERLALDLEPNAVFDLTTVRRWHAARLLDPRAARLIAQKIAEPEDAPTSSMRFETQTMQPSATTSPETRLITHPVSFGPATPFRRPEQAPPPSAPAAAAVFADKEETGAVSRSKGPTLPFMRTATSRAAVPLTSSDLGALRAQGERPVTSGFGSDSTAFVRAPVPASSPSPAFVPSPSGPPAFAAPAPPVAFAPIAPPAAVPQPQGTIGQSLSLGGPSAFGGSQPSPNVAPPPAATHSAAAAGPSGGSKVPAESAAAAEEERVNRILKEIWKGDRTLSQILEEHGISEVEWRVLRRKASKPR